LDKPHRFRLLLRGELTSRSIGHRLLHHQSGLIRGVHQTRARSQPALPGTGGCLIRTFLVSVTQIVAAGIHSDYNRATMRVCRLFVASSSDVSEERELLVRAIEELNRTVGRDLDVHVELVRWETDVAPDTGRPQELINHLVDECDVFVGILWRRFGMPTGEFDGGTEEEYERAYQRWSAEGRPRILFYFGEEPAPPPKTVAEAEQLVQVARMRERLERAHLLGNFEDAADFERNVRDHLNMALRELYRPGQPKLSPGLRVLLEGHLAACRESGVPFLTPSILLALFDIKSGIAMRCLESVETGLATSVRDTLASAVKQGRVGEGRPFEEVDLDAHEAVRAAGRLAAEDGAGEINAAYLFLAALRSESSTVRGLERKLGEDGFDQLKRCVSRGGPRTKSTGDIDF
ncbi:MAG: DUF4062 domain-containing protein, partial [Planctomycetota bacterium]